MYSLSLSLSLSVRTLSILLLLRFYFFAFFPFSCFCSPTPHRHHHHRRRRHHHHHRHGLAPRWERFCDALRNGNRDPSRHTCETLCRAEHWQRRLCASAEDGHRQNVCTPMAPKTNNWCLKRARVCTYLCVERERERERERAISLECMLALLCPSWMFLTVSSCGWLIFKITPPPPTRLSCCFPFEGPTRGINSKTEPH